MNWMEEINILDKQSIEMRSSKGTIHCRPFQPCQDHHGHVFPSPATIESVDGPSTAHGRDAALLGFLVNDADPHAPKPRWGRGLVVGHTVED